MVILSGVLVGVFQFPADLVLCQMVPGTALGVLLGDLTYTCLEVRLMRRAGRDDVTAMPVGIETPTLLAIGFGMPRAREAHDSRSAPGLAYRDRGIKAMLAFAGDRLRSVVPPPALLGFVVGVTIMSTAFLCCKECGQATFIYEEGCEKCLSCGFNEC